MTTPDDYSRTVEPVQTDREVVLLFIATEATEALKMADLYLDGFVWITEPEFSELEAIKAASKRAQRLLDEVRGAISG